MSWIVLPFRVRIELGEPTSVGLPAPPPVVTIEVEPPGFVHDVAVEAAGLTAWSIRAGHLIEQTFAGLLGYTVSPPDLWLVFAAQAQREDAGGDRARSQGAAYNNPLNLTDAGGTIHWPGQVGRYLDRFAAFTTLVEGAAAAAANYMAETYAAVQAAYRSGDPRALARAIEDSPWDEGHYGGTFTADVDALLRRLGR